MAESVIVIGTCFLTGIHCDPEFDDCLDSSDCLSTASARIEFCSNTKEWENKESLLVKVTYSAQISFELDLNVELCEQIVFDNSSVEEKATLTLLGLTHYFELTSIVIRDKHIISFLKSFSKRRQTVISLNKQQIDAHTFYAIGKGRTEKDHDSVFSSVFETFARQEWAFRCFDEKISENPSIKLFTFESLMTGKRQFLVADMQSFLTRYLSLDGSKRHVYELIREDFPCRLYFDLEFSIPANPGVNGLDLVEKLIHLVTWKVYEIFGLTLDANNFIDLDSSTDVKFSHHLTVLLFDKNVTSEQMATKKRRRYDVLPEFWGKEILFRNNIEVGMFVNIIVGDELLADSNADQNDSNRHLPLQLPRVHCNKVPRPSCESFFVYNSARSAQTCFVDLGVYTRNRAFRMLSSCKHGKTARLRVMPPSAGASGHGSASGGKVNYFVKKEDSATSAPHREFFSRILERTFVVPICVTSSRQPDDGDEAWLQPPFAVLPGIKDICAGSPRLLQSPSAMLAAAWIKRASFGDVSGRNESGEVSVRFDYESKTLVSIAVIASSQNSYPVTASPFPLVDAFVLRLARRGGAVGRISQWLLKSITTSALPADPTASYTSTSIAITNMNTSTGVENSALGGATSSIAHIPPSVSTFHLDYQIAGNRFCQNINRPHKSNNIMFEVNLSAGFARQKCWDVDCRGFRSEPMPMPVQSAPSLLELNETVGDIVIRNELLRDSPCFC